MNRNDVLQEINKKINLIKENELIIEEQNYLDIRGVGLNSIEVMTLIVYLEDFYEIEISDEELLLNRYVHVKDLMDVIIDKL